MKYVAYVTSALLLAGAAVPVHADTKTFGQFLQRTPDARLFQYVKQDSGAAKKATIRTTGTETGNTLASIPIFYILSAPGLPVDLTGLQNAHLTVSFVSNLGTTGGGLDRVQLFDTVTAGTISIIRDVAAAEGSGTRTNLLTVSFTNAELDASNNAGSFTFKTMPTSVITYTSDFLSFDAGAAKDFSFSFSGASPTFSAPLGSSGRTDRFSGTGTFAITPVPEISTWGMMMLGFGVAGVAMRNGRRRKDLLTV
jgi:hypothetical protein